MTYRRIFNLVGFQIGWFACVLGAAAGFGWVGPLVVAVLVTLHFIFLRPSQRREEWTLLIFTAVLGAFLDSLLAAVGLIRFLTTPFPDWLSPPWMISLWVNFAITLHFSMSWLRGRYLLGAAFGALGGPLAYLAGERLGAIEFPTATWVTLALLALVWAAAIVVLLRQAERSFDEF